MKLILMADGVVGHALSEWLVNNYPGDISLIVTTSENAIFSGARNANIDCVVFDNENLLVSQVRDLGYSPDLGMLAWWPKIIKKKLLALPSYGFINTHPSLLPHNRGKHYNFWALVERAPFGVSLHFVDDGIDSGNIIAQKAIAYDWEDTGATLYEKAQETMVQLIQESYPKIRCLNIPSKRQDLDQGTIHYAHEIEEASVVVLDQTYRARDLLNLIRARTFPGHPACRFIDNDEEYEVRIAIKRKK